MGEMPAEGVAPADEDDGTVWPPEVPEPEDANESAANDGTPGAVDDGTPLAAEPQFTEED